MKRKMEQMRQPYQTSERRNEQKKESNKVHADGPGTAPGQSAKTNDIFGKFQQANGKPAKADYIDFEEVKEDQEINHP